MSNLTVNNFLNFIEHTRYLVIDTDTMNLFANRPSLVVSGNPDPTTTFSLLNQ